MANPILVGYYDASRGYGDGNQVGPINVAGYTPVKLDTLRPDELENVDIILSQNPDNGNLGSELWNNDTTSPMLLTMGLYLSYTIDM